MTPPSPSTLALLALAAVGGGCISFDRAPLPKRRYLLHAERPEAQPAAAEGPVLVVPSFRVSPAFAGLGFVTRNGDGTLDVSLVDEFLVDPGELVADATRTWLLHSGRVHALVHDGSFVRPTHRLEADVAELSCDRSGDAPVARIALRAALLDVRGGDAALLWSGELAETEPVADDSDRALVDAWSAALARLLAELERQLASALSH